jgi:hypothetical protein
VAEETTLAANNGPLDVDDGGLNHTILGGEGSFLSSIGLLCRQKAKLPSCDIEPPCAAFCVPVVSPAAAALTPRASFYEA